MKRRNLIISVGLFAIVFGLCSLVPLPHTINVPVVIRLHEGEPVIVVQPGILKERFVSIGDRVEAHQLLAVLSNPELNLEVEKIRGKIDELQARIEASERNQLTQSTIDLELAAKRAELASLHNQFDSLTHKAGFLQLRSSVPGVVIDAPYKPPPSTSKYELPTWDGSLFDDKNLNAKLEPDTVFCMIGEPESNKVEILVNQSYIDKIKRGQDISILLEKFSGVRIRSTITNITADPTEMVPQELSKTNGGPIEVKRDSTGQEKPIEVYYNVSGELGKTELPLRSGYRGWARIRVERSTLGNRLWRYVRSIINSG